MHQDSTCVWACIENNGCVCWWHTQCHISVQSWWLIQKKTRCNVRYFILLFLSSLTHLNCWITCNQITLGVGWICYRYTDDHPSIHPLFIPLILTGGHVNLKVTKTKCAWLPHGNLSHTLVNGARHAWQEMSNTSFLQWHCRHGNTNIALLNRTVSLDDRRGETALSSEPWEQSWKS